MITIPSSSVLILTIVLAIIPTSAWVAFYYWQYRKLSIPIMVSIGVFAFGAFAVLTSIMIQRPLLELLSPVTRAFLEGKLASLTPDEMYRSFIMAFLIAAPSEEITKMFGVLIIAYPNHKKLNRYFDGMILGVLAGLGFALAENIVYFYPLAKSGQYPVLAGSFIMRFLVATVAHSLYSGVAGFYIAKAKLNKGKRVFYFTLAFLLPVLMHGFYNFYLFTRNVYYALFIIAFSLFVFFRIARNRKNLEVQIRRGEAVARPFFRDQEFEEKRYKATKHFRSDKTDTIADYKQEKIHPICPKCYRQNLKHRNFCTNCHTSLVVKEEK